MEKRRLQEFEPLYSQGVKYMEHEEWQKALDIFLGLVERAPDFRDVEEKRAEVERQIKLADLYRQGMERLAQRDWQGAIGFFMQVIRIDADHRDVSAQLKEASRQQMLEIVYNEGLSHFRRGRWSRAREKFDEVLAKAPGYQEADQYLKEAKEQEQLAEWYGEAQEHLRRQNWQQAIECLQRVARLNPDYKDASKKLDTAREERTLEELYRDGMRYFGQRSWQDAKGSFAKILERRSDGYRDARKKLEEIDKQLRLAAQLEEALECESDEEWATAIGIYVGILTEDTGYPEVAERVARAQKEKELLEKYRQAERYLDDEEWIAAIEALNWIVDRRADYKDAAQKLQLAKDKEEARVSYVEGLEHLGRGEWRQAAEKLERVVQLDPGNEDAAKKLEDAGRKERKAALYREGMEYVHSGQWQKAIQRFEQVIDADPDDQSARALLEDAKKQWQEQTQAARQDVSRVRRWGFPLALVLGVALLLIFLPRLFTETRNLSLGNLLVTPDFVGALAGVFGLVVSIIALLIPTERLYRLLERDKRLRVYVVLLLLLVTACLLTLLVMGLVGPEEPTPAPDNLGTPIVTPIPTASPTPTITPIPIPSLVPAVTLEEPKDGACLGCESPVMLRWSCPYTLQESECYQLRVKGQSLSDDSPFHPAEDRFTLPALSPGTYNWAVTVVRSTGLDEYVEVSEESEWRSFRILPAPVVHSISPTSIFQGTSVPVVISGENFTHSLALTIGVPLQITFVNSSTITATVPTTLEVGEYPVIVKDSMGNGTSSTSFTVEKQPTPTPTVVPPTPLPPSYPPPKLIGIDVGCNVTFRWDWPRELAEDEWFAVRVGIVTPHSVVWVKDREYTHSLDDAGDYVWEVAICRGDPADEDCSGDKLLAVSERGTFWFAPPPEPRPIPEPP
jgi:tetratricopeptide (TPR) repeat protein